MPRTPKNPPINLERYRPRQEPQLPALLDRMLSETGDALFRAIAQTSPTGICVAHWDDGRVVWANCAFTAILDAALRDRDIAGMRLDAVLPGFAESDLPDILQAVAVTGEQFSMHGYEYRHFERGTAYFNWTLTRLPVPEQSGVFLMAQVVEVTQLVVAEREARRLREEAERQRRNAEAQKEMFDLVLSSTPDRHYIYDTDGRFIYANKAMCERLGRTQEQIVGMTVADLGYPENAVAAHREQLAFVKQTRQPVQGEFRLQTFTVHPECYEYRLIPVLGEDGGVRLITGSSRDITAQKHVEIRLRQKQEKLQLAMEAADLGMFDFYPATGELVWSPTLRQQFGIAADAPLQYGDFLARVHPEDRERVETLRRQALLANGAARFDAEYRIVRKNDGQERWIHAIGRTLFDEDGAPVRFIGTTIDVTESKQIEQRIVAASKHDMLTGLPNRALIYEYGERVLAMAGRLGTQAAMLFIDLDRFKPINDQYGHETGDRVLQEVAGRIESCTRKGDIIGRLGGDEFLAMLPSLDEPGGAQTAAGHIVRLLAQPVRVGEVEHSISCSIGISLFPDHAPDIDGLVRAADLAMYAAKNSGRNNWQLYSDALEREYHERSQLEARLREVVNRNRLYLLYQPIVDLETEDVIGVEALVRMPSVGDCVHSASQFIPVAESAGLIGRMGSWVVEEACRQHRRWREQGLPPLRMSINVSPLQFREKHFARHLIAAVQSAGADTGCVEIEVTESTVMENLAQTIDTLRALKDSGIRVALDDFGTGYSSLSQLASLPLDRLKIDRTFVARLHEDAPRKAIVEMIIALGKTLRLDVIGEGIETEDDLERLRGLGCEGGQGYLFTEPLDADAFVDWYRDRRLAGAPGRWRSRSAR
ncbi:MAG: sensor domain-containing protein [Burkholderiaceae bacterium]